MNITTNNHEVIFAIVNSGFADEVMEVAKACGARGGTILTARGVAQEETAAFFGFTIHAEKEIVMIVVPKKIKADVLNAIYAQLGMDRQAHGIAFSLPVTDTAGLVEITTEAKPAKE